MTAKDALDTANDARTRRTAAGSWRAVARMLACTARRCAALSSVCARIKILRRLDRLLQIEHAIRNGWTSSRGKPLSGNADKGLGSHDRSPEGTGRRQKLLGVKEHVSQEHADKRVVA